MKICPSLLMEVFTNSEERMIFKESIRLKFSSKRAVQTQHFSVQDKRFDS